METPGKLLIMASFACLLCACSKFPQFGDELAGTELKSGGSNSGPVHIVTPNGVDDTQALKDIFELAVTQPGSVVQLLEGTYHINFIEIREFYGKFKGAGKGKTVITTVPDLSVGAMISQKLNTVLIRFVGGDVCMSDMTIMTPPGPLSTGAENYIDGLAGFSARTYQYTSLNDHIRAVVDRVEFIGYWENVNHGLKAEYGVTGTKTDFFWPLSAMDITVTNCDFDGFYYYGALIQHFNGGKIVAGIKNSGNTFDNIFYASLGIWSNVNVDITVEGNTFRNPANTRYGIELYTSPIPRYLQQVDQSKVTTLNIEQNVFDIGKTIPTGGGMLINDRRRFFFPDDLPMIVQVKNNKFILNDAPCAINCFNMYGMVIRNNNFSGSGQYGVKIMGPISASAGGGYPLPPNDNGLMLGNNFSNSAFSVASVLFDVRTNNWTIVGGNLGETLIDMTNGNGNHLVTGMNMNIAVVPPGETISDNLP